MQLSVSIQLLYNFSMQAQSKTEQLIYRISYRNHKKRLTQIKQNNTSLQFYNHGKGRPEDKKKILMLRMKREEIQIQNEMLQQKIAKIQGKKRQRESLKVKQIKHKKRYLDDQNNEDDKIQVLSDYGEGQTKICVVPYTNKRQKIMSYSSSHKRDSNPNPFSNNKSPPPETNEQFKQSIDKNESNEKKTNSQPYLNQPKIKGPLYNKLSSIRESISKPQEERLYNQPQKQSNRLVMFKKTRIPQPMLSYLIQISLIKKSLLITAYAMGIYNHTIKLVLQPKKSQQLLKQVDQDYEKIWERVSIDSINQTIKIVDHLQTVQVQQQDTNNHQSSIHPVYGEGKKETQKKYEVQQQFIKRNYDTIMEKKQKQKNTLLMKQQKQRSREKEINSKPNSAAKKTGSSFKHSRIGDDWKKSNDRTFEKKEEEKIEAKVQKKHVKNKSEIVKEESIKFREKDQNKKKTENASVIKNESIKSKKIDNMSNISSIKGKTNISKEESIKESLLKSNKQSKKDQNKEDDYDEEFQEEDKNQSKIQQSKLQDSNYQSKIEESKNNESKVNQSKLQKSGVEEYDQQYEQEFENENEGKEKQNKVEEQQYDMEYEEEVKNKNESNIKDSMVYEEDFQDNEKDNKKDKDNKKEQNVEEQYDEEFQN